MTQQMIRCLEGISTPSCQAHEELAMAGFRVPGGSYVSGSRELAGSGPSLGGRRTSEAVVKFCETTEPAARHFLPRLPSCQRAAEMLGFRIMNYILTAGDRREVGISGRHMGGLRVEVGRLPGVSETKERSV